jgi:hypothetical protein
VIEWISHPTGRSWRGPEFASRGDIWRNNHRWYSDAVGVKRVPGVWVCVAIRRDSLWWSDVIEAPAMLVIGNDEE